MADVNLRRGAQRMRGGAQRMRRAPRPQFRPDIEGLRGVAILTVIAFHVGALSGGFVGVDVFFVISGFLITRLLWTELGTTGGIRLTRFYAARARRLLPAAGVVLLLTAVAATVVLPPLRARSVLDDGLAGALYVANYRFAVAGTDYLRHDAPSPLQHYWSLGVEEQFYLLWPALLLGIAVLARWRRGRLGTLSVTPFLVGLTAVAAASFAVSLRVTATSPPWAFFSLPTRAWELATGALVALSAPLWRRMPAALAVLAGFGGLAMIAAAVVGFDERTQYPGSAALLPVLGTTVLIAAGCATPTHGAGRVLSMPWLRGVGRLSYSWYLWHWPVLVFAPLIVGHQLGAVGRAAAVTASFALAVITWRYVERPLRYSQPLRRSAGRSLALGSVVTAAAVGAALLLPLVVPAPVGRGAPATVAIVHPQARHNATSDPLAGAFAAAQAMVDASARHARVPAALSPPLAEAAIDKPEAFFNGCVRVWREVGVPNCVSGDPDGQTTVALVGDSHAAMWQPALEPVATENHWRLVTMAKVTCPLLDLPIISPYLGRTYSECQQWRAEALQRLISEEPELVVLSMSRRYGPDFGFSAYDPAWMRGIETLLATIRNATGARILVLGPVPDPHADVPVCLSAHLEDALACAPARREALDADGIAAEAEATGAAGGQYAELSRLFCSREVCPVVVGRDLVFRDDNHISVSYARTLAPALGLVAQQALTPQS